jgi:glycerol-3-phosphate O-acyltransferase
MPAAEVKEVPVSSPAHIGSGDRPRVDRLVVGARFRGAAARLAEGLGRPNAEVRAEVAGFTGEMAAWHQPLARELWSRFGRWLLRGYRFQVDATELQRVCELNRSQPVVWLLSHRSYLDARAFSEILTRNGMRAYAMGGINMNFWPFGPLARRNGVVFIRRDVRADPVYRLALRQYVAGLVRRRESLVWSIEGGRTRTGKLRPPRYGLLRYVADAAVAAEQEVLLVRDHPVAGDADLRTPDQVRGVLDQLADSRIVTRSDAGTDTVWVIAAHQHLVAAFYRNSVIHFFINRAIAELALQRIIEERPDDLRETAWQECLRLRELLKFDFFFARKREFAVQMQEELMLIDPDWEHHLKTESGDVVVRHARECLRGARPHSAALPRPFLDAYLVVANRLAACDPRRPVDEAQLLQDCLGLAQQWHLQGRLVSAESVSLELLRTALRLAAHRGLLDGGADELLARRRVLDAELRDTLQRIANVADIAGRWPGSMP